MSLKLFHGRLIIDPELERISNQFILNFDKKKISLKLSLSNSVLALTISS